MLLRSQQWLVLPHQVLDANSCLSIHFLSCRSQRPIPALNQFLQRLSNKRTHWQLKLGCCIDFFVDKDGSAEVRDLAGLVYRDS